MIPSPGDRYVARHREEGLKSPVLIVEVKDGWVTYRATYDSFSDQDVGPVDYQPLEEFLRDYRPS